MQRNDHIPDNFNLPRNCLCHNSAHNLSDFRSRCARHSDASTGYLGWINLCCVTGLADRLNQGHARSGLSDTKNVASSSVP
jgi:hypothetical protein